MTDMTIYEDDRTVSRADLSAWLRQLADQLDSDGQIFYGAAGRLVVADQVHCELEIERENSTEISVEIEFSWTSPEAATSEDQAGDDEDEKDEDEEDEEDEEAGDEEAGDGDNGEEAEPTATEPAGDSAVDSGESSPELESGTGSEPSAEPGSGTEPGKEA